MQGSNTIQSNYLSRVNWIWLWMTDKFLLYFCRGVLSMWQGIFNQFYTQPPPPTHHFTPEVMQSGI